VIGFATPSLVIFFLEVGPGGRSATDATQDILGRQFAPGDNLFLLALISLIPFVVLDVLLLRLPATFSPRRIACVAVCGLVGILALMVPIHWDVWSPLYTGKRMSSTAVLGLGVAPIICIVTMLIGVAVGWLVSSLAWFRPAEQPRASLAEPGPAADRPRG
jgi:hypothetical protein